MKRKAYDGIYNQYIKRGIDFCLALVGLIIAAIPMAIVAVAIKAESKGPVIFKQDRIGYKGKVYKMYKFRSMCVGAEKGGVYSDNKDSRVTKVGKFIRATSIDELPQLVNVLKGDMALIGFRSPLTYHPWPWSEYTEEQKKMFNVRPGITGWAQVNGRKTVEWNKRIELNGWYAEHVSFWLDVKILFMTVFKVLTNADNENVGEDRDGRCMVKGKPKSRNQIVKWLRNPHSDSAEYKMWGNGVALPNVYFVLSGIVYYAQFPEG